MFCIRCGRVIPEAARFCPFCGNEVAQAVSPPGERICPECGSTVAEGLMFCNKCGTKLDAAQRHRAQEQMVRTLESIQAQQTQAEPSRMQTETSRIQPEPADQFRQQSRPREQAQSAGSGTILESVNRPRPLKLSRYKGDSKLGVAKATGLLNVFHDHLEFHKTMGSSGASVFGLVGMAVSSSRAKKEPPVVFAMADVAGARNSKYMGAFPAMVLELKNGEQYTFAGPVSGDDLKKCVAYVNQHIN